MAAGFGALSAGRRLLARSGRRLFGRRLLRPTLASAGACSIGRHLAAAFGRRAAVCGTQQKSGKYFASAAHFFLVVRIVTAHKLGTCAAAFIIKLSCVNISKYKLLISLSMRSCTGHTHWGRMNHNEAQEQIAVYEARIAIRCRHDLGALLGRSQEDTETLRTTATGPPVVMHFGQSAKLISAHLYMSRRALPTADDRRTIYEPNQRT